jgi:type II secretory pathway component GspD/PulD (secretin)
MNRTQLIRSALAAALTTIALQAAGQTALEIIALRHRTVDQVLPVLRPLLEPGATLTGQGNQLIVRTSPANLVDLKRALDAIDRPLRRLQISVRFDDAAQAASQGVETSGRVGNRGARVDVRAHDSRASASERVDQRLQVLEGGRAFIMTGQATPMPQRQIIETPGGVVVQDSMVVRETGTGFEAVPRLSGDTVLLEIAPRRETLNQQQHLATTVSARLGEWFEVGGAAQTASRDDRGIAGVSRARSAESRRVWLKVEEIRP